jgi:hypothetical protein
VHKNCSSGIAGRGVEGFWGGSERVWVCAQWAAAMWLALPCAVGSDPPSPQHDCSYVLLAAGTTSATEMLITRRARRGCRGARGSGSGTCRARSGGSSNSGEANVSTSA